MMFLFIAYFDWKFGVFQQTVVRVYYIFKQILKQSHNEHKEQELDMTYMNLNLNDVVEEKNVNEENQHLLLVPYQGKKGDFVIKYMNKRMKSYQLTLGQKIAFTVSKFSTCFQWNDKTKFKQITRYC